MSRPNLLYVFADQWRHSALGYAGNPQVQTPRIDAFAAEAVDCHRAIASSPVCCPARASLLTGLYPDHHGVFLNDAPLDPGLPSLGKAFAAAGYATAWVGKWHVDGHGRTSYIPPERRQGFQHFAALECTHDYNASRYYLDDDPEPRTWDGYDAQAQTDHLCRWLAERDGAQPFCAVLSWGPPHNPYHTAPEADRARYAAEDMQLHPNVPTTVAERARADLAGYYAHCTALDRCFGQLLDQLEALGLAQDTIVVFTADHGDFIGSHGMWDKQGPWEESLRVPFLVRGPGLPAGRNASVISSVDHFPTLAALCGVELAAPVQGRDLSAELRGGTTPARNEALCGAYHTFGNWPKQARREGVDPLMAARCFRGLRDQRWLYCEDHDGPWLLYDVDADPYQQRNLVGDPRAAAAQADLAARLHRRLDELDDEFLPDGEYAARWGYPVGPGETLNTR